MVMIRHLRIVLILPWPLVDRHRRYLRNPKNNRQAQETAPQADSSESPASPPLGYWRYKIVEAANAEWVYFGQQTVVIDGDEESIPHVGIWEDDDHEPQ
jgi:hypothetical protein